MNDVLVSILLVLFMSIALTFLLFKPQRVRLDYIHLKIVDSKALFRTIPVLLLTLTFGYFSMTEQFLYACIIGVFLLLECIRVSHA